MWYGDSLYSSEQLCYAGFVKRCWWYSSRKGSFLIRQIRKGVTNIYWKGNCYISTCLVQVLLCVCVEFESKTLAVDLIILRGLKHMILKTKGKLWKINWKHSELYMCRRKIKVAWYKKRNVDFCWLFDTTMSKDEECFFQTYEFLESELLNGNNLTGKTAEHFFQIINYQTVTHFNIVPCIIRNIDLLEAY